MPDGPAPRYHRVKQALLEEIERGGHSPDEPFLTTREVCERFGVSTTTAVRAIGELAREGVLVRKRGRGTFVAERTEREGPEVHAGSSRTIGCILNELAGRHNSEILRGVESVCREAGYRLLLFDSADSAETEALNLRRAVEAGVDGLIVFPAEGYRNVSSFDALRRRGVPLVMIDRYYPSLATNVVVPDNFAIGYELTEYLIKAGHRHIATLWGETNCTSVLDRLAGYRQALRSCNLPLVPELAALTSYDRKPQVGRLELLKSWLGKPYHPTAFLCSNGYTMALLANDLVGLGVNLTDVDLAGMDDVGPYDLLPLATVAAILPSFEMGSEAAKLVLERAKGGGSYRPAHHHVLPVKVFKKESAQVHLHAAAAKGA